MGEKTTKKIDEIEELLISSQSTIGE